MKNNVIIFTMFLFSILFSYQAVAGDKVLMTDEVNNLVSNRTITIAETEPDKKTGKKTTLTAYFSELGGARAIYPDGSSENYSWSVDKNGSLCALNNKRWGGGMCGFVMTKGNNTYNFYRDKSGSRKPAMQDGRAVPTRHWKHELTFSNLRSGEHLKRK